MFVTRAGSGKIHSLVTLRDVADGLGTAICIAVLLGILQFCDLTSLIVLYINALLPSCLLGEQGTPSCGCYTIYLHCSADLEQWRTQRSALSHGTLCLPLTY